MRNIYIFLLVVISSNLSNAQFSPRTEYEYLKLINEQHQKALIEDNINNAEIAAQKFINDTFNIYTGLFYGALANSYKLLNKRSLSLYYWFYPCLCG